MPNRLFLQCKWGLGKLISFSALFLVLTFMPTRRTPTWRTNTKSYNVLRIISSITLFWRVLYSQNNVLILLTVSSRFNSFNSESCSRSWWNQKYLRGQHCGRLDLAQSTNAPVEAVTNLNLTTVPKHRGIYINFITNTYFSHFERSRWKPALNGTFKTYNYIYIKHLLIKYICICRIFTYQFTLSKIN